MMHAKVSSFSAAVGHERESTRPIRALHRGLDVLTELNRLERAAINTLATAVVLPRNAPTDFRFRPENERKPFKQFGRMLARLLGQEGERS